MSRFVFQYIQTVHKHMYHSAFTKHTIHAAMVNIRYPKCFHSLHPVAFIIRDS